MVDVRQLAYFVAVVEGGGFTAASRTLNLAQSALSQNLQNLEAEFGQALVIRHSRGVEPTTAGKRLLEHARGIIASVHNAKADLREFLDAPHGQIRLGLPRSLCGLVPESFIIEWTQRHPNVDLQIFEESSATAADWLHEGLLDIAVTSSPTEEATIIAEGLLQERMCAILPPGEGHAWEEIRLADLAERDLILYTTPYVSRRLIDAIARYSSIPLNVRHEINSVDLSIRMVEAGLGATIQPFLAVCKYHGPAILRPIGGPPVIRRLKLARLRQKMVTPYEEELCILLRAKLQEAIHQADCRGLLDLDGL